MNSSLPEEKNPWKRMKVEPSSINNYYLNKAETIEREPASPWKDRKITLVRPPEESRSLDDWIGYFQGRGLELATMPDIYHWLKQADRAIAESSADSELYYEQLTCLSADIKSFGSLLTDTRVRYAVQDNLQDKDFSMQVCHGPRRLDSRGFGHELLVNPFSVDLMYATDNEICAIQQLLGSDDRMSTVKHTLSHLVKQVWRLSVHPEGTCETFLFVTEDFISATGKHSRQREAVRGVRYD